MQEGEWRRLGGGAAGAARSLGLDSLAMSVKGISIQNVDPWPEPAWGLRNATESLGAAAHIWTYGDFVHGMHEAGVEPVIKPESTPAEMAGHVKRKQDLVAALDAMTVCAFSSYAFDAEDYAAALGFVTHASWSATELLAASGVWLLGRGAGAVQVFVNRGCSAKPSRRRVAFSVTKARSSAVSSQSRAGPCSRCTNPSRPSSVRV